MHTQTLPIQVSSAGPAPQRANATPSTDGAQFSQALSREMEQHHNSPAPAAASPAAPAKPQAAPAPASQPAPPKTAESKSAKTDTDTDTSADEEKDDAANAAAASPVADMLAFVASFNKPAAAAAAAAAATTGMAATELPVKAGKADALGADGKPLPAGDDKGKGLAFKDVAQAVAGADNGLAAAAPALKASAKADPALANVDTVAPRAREALADITALKEPAAAAPAMAPVQQSSLAMAQAITGAPTDRIAARVGTPGWDNQVGQKIVWMIAGKEQSASLTLNPPDMGPMQVVLSVTNDQATVTFSAAQPEVRQALENAMPKLREMMGESGIALGNATVNSGASDQRQAQQGEQARGHGAGGRFGGVEAPIGSATPHRLRVDGTGLVDTFA